MAKNCVIKVKSGFENISKAYGNPACFDVHCKYGFRLPPQSSKLVNTGIIAEIDPNYYIEMLSKSGLSTINNVEKGAGVIDSDYRGEWRVILYNFGEWPVYFVAGDKIAQAAIREKITPVFERVDKLTETERGTKGFGSSDY